MTTINLPGGGTIEERGTVPARAQPRWITQYALAQRFTLTERATIEFAGIDNPTASTQDRMTAATLRTHQRDLDRANYVDLDLPALASGLATMEALGLIGAGRAAEILADPILPHERYEP